jgi:hypothetical protein
VGGVGSTAERRPPRCVRAGSGPEISATVPSCPVIDADGWPGDLTEG